jgi:hypothetical protein
VSSSARELPPEVEAVFATAAEPARAELRRLRALIESVADGLTGVAPLSASLKWGEPSFAPGKAGIGSSVRLAALRDGRVAMHFICHTGLVDRFRDLYPKAFDYVGNRSILIEPGSRFDQAALSHCVAMALTYHQDKRQPAH